MSRWNVSLASLLAAAVVIGGCTIYTEGGGAKRPPPPPPPPAKAPPPPAEAPPAGTTGGTTLKLPGKIKLKGVPSGKTDQVGSLIVTVADGTCDISVGATRHGVTNKVEASIAVGDWDVTCQPEGGTLQTKTATVKTDVVATVVFSISDPGKSTTTSLPVNKVPPVGRPTPQ